MINTFKLKGSFEKILIGAKRKLFNKKGMFKTVPKGIFLND